MVMRRSLADEEYGVYSTVLRMRLFELGPETL